MKQLYNFIIEKLKINSKSQVNSKTNDDPLSWEVGDIFWFDGFHIEFYKIIKRTSKQFELHNIPVKLISGYFNSVKYTCEPDIDKESEYITKGRISKDNMLIIDKRKGYSGLWDGKPIEGCGLK
jgi:hypothetical protein